MYDLGPGFKIDPDRFGVVPKHVFKGNKYRISVLSECLVRLEYSSNGKFNDFLTSVVRNRKFREPVYMHKEDQTFLKIETKYFSLTYVKETKFSEKTLYATINNTKLMWTYGTKEVRNFGSTSMSLDNCKELPSLEKGIYSPDGFFTLDDSNSLIVDTCNNVYNNNNNENIDLYLFIYNKDFGMALRDYFVLTGNPPLIPRYALGNWWSRDNNYDDKGVIELLDKFKFEDIPLSVLVLDNGWNKIDPNNEFKTGFSFDTTKFKDVKGLIGEVHRRGIHFGLKINPAYGFYPIEDYYNTAKQYIKENEKGFIEFNPYDPKCVDIFLKLFIKPLEYNGVDLFWNDYNSKDKNKMYILNKYLYLNSNIQNRGLILGRNSTLGGHTVPVSYSGKIPISWETLSLLPFYTLNSSNIGLSWWSHDIGGSIGGIEDSDLYIRSLQLGVFSPILRFNVESGNYFKREPWKWDKVTKDIAAYYLRLRHKLIPYIYTEAYKYHKHLKPIITPMYYSNINLYDDPVYVNQYYFGEQFMIVPIVSKKDEIIDRTIQKFYIPEGVWYDYMTGKRFLGNHKYISFYKEEDYPIFVKAGSIIPHCSDDKLESYRNPDSMDIHIFPGVSNNYDLYEDDGYSNEYKNGKFLITNIDYNYRASNYTVIIRGKEGDKSVIPANRTYRIIFRNTKKADNVKVYENEKEIPYEIEATENDFIVIVKNFNTQSQLVVNCYGKDIEIDAVKLIKDDIESILYDLKINTKLKDDIASIMFSDLSLAKKRIGIRKLKKKGLDKRNLRVFQRLIEYMEM